MTKPSRMTSNGLRLAALALACAATGSANAASATANSSGTVVMPIDIVKNTDLAFGSFAASATPGSVILSPNGTRAKTGGVTLMAGAVTAAQFTVTGTAGAGYSISLNSSASLSDGGSNSMAFEAVSDTTASAITSGAVTAGVLTAGTQNLYVGGVLTVGVNQAAGVYSGSVEALVEYN